jgi:hypothetical protein
MLQQALSQSLGYRWQFSGCRVLDEARVSFLAEIDAAADDATWLPAGAPIRSACSGRS